MKLSNFIKKLQELEVKNPDAVVGVAGKFSLQTVTDAVLEHARDIDGHVIDSESFVSISVK